MRLCLHRLAKVMPTGGVFFASYVEQPQSVPIDHIFQRGKGGRTYFYEKNVFWYHRSDLGWVAEGEPWEFRFVGEYGSPQKQLMVAYTRMPDTVPASPNADRAKLVKARIKAGGPAALVLRARRRAAKIISPY